MNQALELLEEAVAMADGLLDKIGDIDDILDDDRLDAGRGTISAYPLVQRAMGILEVIRSEVEYDES
jgi:hypothetical protein